MITDTQTDIERKTGVEEGSTKIVEFLHETYDSPKAPKILYRPRQKFGIHFGIREYF